MRSTAHHREYRCHWPRSEHRTARVFHALCTGCCLNSGHLQFYTVVIPWRLWPEVFWEGLSRTRRSYSSCSVPAPTVPCAQGRNVGPLGKLLRQFELRGKRMEHEELFEGKKCLKNTKHSKTCRQTGPFVSGRGKECIVSIIFVETDIWIDSFKAAQLIFSKRPSWFCRRVWGFQDTRPCRICCGERLLGVWRLVNARCNQVGRTTKFGSPGRSTTHISMRQFGIGHSDARQPEPTHEPKDWRFQTVRDPEARC